MIDPEKEVSGVIYNGIRLTLAGSGESAPFIVKLTESEGVYSVNKTNQEIYAAMLANTRILITDDMFIMPLIFCQEAEAIFACTADFVDGPENVTVVVRTENGEQTVTILNEPLSTLEDAPSDGKQYARKDGEWSEVESGSGQAYVAQDEAPEDTTVLWIDTDDGNFTEYYTKSEINALLIGKADTDDIPTKTSELRNDSNYITLADLPIYGGEVV